MPQAKEEEERRAAECAALKASLAAGDKLEPAAAEQLMRYLLEEADGSAAKVRVSGSLHVSAGYMCSPVDSVGMKLLGGAWDELLCLCQALLSWLVWHSGQGC